MSDMLEQMKADYAVMTAAEVAAKYGYKTKSIYSLASKHNWPAKIRGCVRERGEPVQKRAFIVKKKTPAPEPVPEPAAAPEPLALTPPPRRELREVKAAPVLAAPAPTPEDVRVQEPITTPPTTPPSIAALRASSWGYKGYGCDFAGTARFLISRLYPTANQPIWTLFKMLLEQGGDLEVISPYHSKPEAPGDYYYSIRIDGGGTYYTAHLHGALVGCKFQLQRAVAFHKSDVYEMTFVKRNPQ